MRTTRGRTQLPCTEWNDGAAQGQAGGSWTSSMSRLQKNNFDTCRKRFFYIAARV